MAVTHWGAAAVVAVVLLLVAAAVALLFLAGVFSSAEEDVQQLKYIRNIYLWTRQSQVVAEELPVFADYSAIFSTKFSPYRATYVITHGFLSSALYNWVIILKDALLSHEDCNVLAICWESGSSRLSYYAVQGRVPEVGDEVAGILERLQKAGGLRLDTLHLIGHSLGAHVSGFVGKRFNGTIARITGLDPAGMGFNGAEAQERLDKSDAQFVDVIHTHACTTIIQPYSCFGIIDSIGDVDVWVNGGEEQPGCVQEGGDGYRVLEDGSPCSHSLSYVYYTESIDYPPSSTRYLARSCPTKLHYYNGSCICSQHPQYMGFNTNQRSLGDFYVNTTATWPYALTDDHCPAAAYTIWQILGIILLSLVAGAAATTACVLAWLRQHPEDQEFFTTEFLFSVLAVAVQYSQRCYDSFREREEIIWLTNGFESSIM